MLARRGSLGLNSSDRLLFIHAGGGKTGSSALQSALAEATPRLAEIGIAYAHAPQTDSAYTITSGNGLPLFHLVQGSDWLTDGERLLESYLDGQPVGICSSEYFGNLSEDDWRKLLATASQYGIQLRVIFYVRSAISYLAACYNQDVKRAGECRDFVDYLREATWHHFDSLTILDRVFSDEQLCVINYDAVRKDIIASFASAFPELAGTRTILAASGNRTVNRSLDSVEIDVMARVNARFGASLSEELSNRLIYRDPERHGGLGIAPEIAADLRRKFEEPIRWVNEQFFANSSTLLEDRGVATPPADPNCDTTPYLVALDWVLEKLEAAGGDAIGHIREQLLRIDWQNSERPEVPEDFDPIAYLLLNDDLIKAGAAPFQHFIDSGKREGRSYHWPLPINAAGDPPIAASVIEARHAAGKRMGDPAAYLRQLYQLESLIHSFATRERSWLDELRREREKGKYDRAELENILSALGEEIVTSLRQSMESLATRQAEHADEVAGLSGNVTSSIKAQGDALSAVVANSASGISSQISSLLTEFERQEGQAQATLQGLSGQFQQLIQSLDEDRAQRVKQVEAREAEAARQEQLLSRYRAGGFWEFLGWSVWRRKRP
jgi:hypothetical protein